MNQHLPLKALGNLLANSARKKPFNNFTGTMGEYEKLSPEEKKAADRHMLDVWSGGAWSRVQRETQADHQDALRDREDWSKR